MKIIEQLFIKYKFLLIVVAASILAVLDLVNYGIPPTHDGEYHVMRFQQFYKVISDGVLYPKWAPDFNNGFGIPLFNYVYPLPNYVSAFFHLLGFGFIESLKLNMAAASIFGAIFMYLWSRKYWGELGGVVSSVFYTFSPYHFLDIYVRGSVGEVWGLALAPALFWSYFSYSEYKRKIFFVLSSIFLALLIMAHNILALIFFGFFILYSLFIIHNSKKKKALFFDSLLICIAGLGLSSPFWLPAIFETKYVVGLQVFDPTRHFPILYKLIYSSWGYGFSGSGERDQMSFQIGIANIIAAVLSLLVLFRTKDRRLFFFQFLLMMAIFLITPFSIFIWENIAALGYIQFPWRLLSLVILLASFLAGSIVQQSVIRNKKILIVASILLILLSTILSIRYAKAPFYHKRSDQHYLSRSNFSDGTNSPGDTFNTKWLSGVPEKRKEKIEVVRGTGEIRANKVKPQEYSFSVNSKGDSIIRINTAYFPGWTALVNNRKVNIVNNKGIMQLNLPEGENNVRIYLSSTPIQKISYIYFLIVVLLLALLRPSKVKSCYN